jgi:hypothetical protein
MKKMRNLAALAIVAIAAIMYTSCDLTDLNAPVITLTGDATMTLEHGEAYTEPGFTATDTEDGDLTASVVVTGVVDSDMAKTYTLTYTVTDASGNQGTATRTVAVQHTKNSISGTYNTTESCTQTGNFGPYSCSITPRTGTEFTITLNNFGDFPATVDLEGTLTGENGLDLNIPSQVVTGATFSGTGVLNEAGTEIVITYVVDDGVDTETCTATWTKQ